VRGGSSNKLDKYAQQDAEPQNKNPQVLTFLPSSAGCSRQQAVISSAFLTLQAENAAWFGMQAIDPKTFFCRHR
jgi:hypothetical protein